MGSNIQFPLLLQFRKWYLATVSIGIHIHRVDRFMNNTRASPTREVYAIPHQEIYRQLILSRLVNVGNTSIKNYKFCEIQALHHSLQKGGTAARLTFSSVGVSNAYSQGRWLTVTHLLPCAYCHTFHL